MPKFHREIPPGDNRERSVCTDCGFVDYENPKIVVGSVCRWEDKFLLCKRAIEPQSGLWTLPAGFLEFHENPVAGAMREAREEANAVIEISALLAIYTIEPISQVQLFHRATLVSPDVSAGEETLDVNLVTWEEIPWANLAFPSVKWALEHDRQADALGVFQPFSNPVESVPIKAT